MPLAILTRAVICLPLLASLPSCSRERNPVPSEGAAPLSPERFTAADRRAAQALSIGDRGALESEGPYAQALLCNKALDAVATQLAGLQALNTEQLDQLEQAQAIFQRRLRQTAAQDGISPTQIERDLKAPAVEDAETADQGRIALACLQSLQPAA
jgi:hypothetical protein